MINKQKIELEYLLKTSSKVLENMVSTPSGLSEWFADDVNIDEDIYTFYWDGSEETARLISKRAGSYMRWKWERNEEDDSFFEIHYEVDPMTKALVLKITDFADDDEVDEITMQWETAIQNLKRIMGA
ncbi:MAG: START-like domain-containing protein [Crocinitomicaceae bacterium]|nr:START-like domain-containing protein [Crocinitomicaceae bacterium]